MADSLKKKEMSEPIKDPGVTPATPAAPPTPVLTAAPVAPSTFPGVNPATWTATMAPMPGPVAKTPLPTPEKTYAMNPKEAAATDDMRDFAKYMRGLADKGELVDAKGNKLPMYTAEKIDKMTPAELYSFIESNPGYANKYFASIGKPGGGIGMYGGAGTSGQVIVPGGGEAKPAEVLKLDGGEKVESVKPPPIPAPKPEQQDPDFWGKIGKIAETLGTGILGAYQAYMAGYAGLTDPNAYFYQTQRQEKIRKETEAEAKAKEEREREWQKEMLAVEQNYRLEAARIDQEFQERLQTSRTAAESREAALDRAQQMDLANKNLAVEREKIAAERGEAAGAMGEPGSVDYMLSGGYSLPPSSTASGGALGTVAPTAATYAPPSAPAAPMYAPTAAPGEAEARAAAYRAARGM